MVTRNLRKQKCSIGFCRQWNDTNLHLYNTKKPQVSFYKAFDIQFISIQNQSNVIYQ